MDLSLSFLYLVTYPNLVFLHRWRPARLQHSLCRFKINSAFSLAVCNGQVRQQRWVAHNRGQRVPVLVSHPVIFGEVGMARACIPSMQMFNLRIRCVSQLRRHQVVSCLYPMEETRKAKSALNTLNVLLDDLQDKLDPLFQQSLPDSLVALSPIQQAKLQTVLPYVVSSRQATIPDPTQSFLSSRE